MKKYVVYYKDYNIGAVSPVDNIEVEDDYTVEDYNQECQGNMDTPWDLENGEIIFEETDE